MPASEQMPSYARPLAAWILGLIDRSLIVKRLGGHNQIPASAIHPHNILSSSHGDSHADDVPANGDLLTYNDGTGEWEASPPVALTNHDHSGDAGDGGTFDAANLTSDAADDGDVLTADGLGGAAWEALPAASPHNLLSATHGDTTPESPPTEGNVPVGRSGSWVSEAPVDIGSDDAEIVSINAVEQAVKPTQPAAGHRQLYAKDDGWYDEDDAGTETKIGADHAPVTLAADADALLGLSGQEIGLDTQSANRVFAGPGSGAAADPTFRALVAADLGTGAPDGTKYLRDDLSWQPVAGITGEILVDDDFNILMDDDGNVLWDG